MPNHRLSIDVCLEYFLSALSRTWRRKLHVLESSHNKIMIKLPVKLWCRSPIRNYVRTDSEL